METINELAIPPFIPKQHPMSFTGTGGEYFRIWIVNLALTILTLGIYSAWAKVRKNRYFYGHTKLVGESFEYHASPISILKGRILAAAIFGFYYFISQASPAASFPFLIVLAFASPWLICRSLAFNAVNSSYRNIRFRFIAKYVEALKIIVGIGVLIFLTLGLLFPFYQAKRMRFIADHHFYGRTRFNLEDFSNVTIYKIYGKLSALF